VRVPLSISDSERRDATRAIVVLLVSLIFYFGALEAVTRIAFPRINHVWRSIAAGHRAAITLQPIAANQSTTILMVGNSYMDLGVNRENLQQELSPLYAVAYLPVWGTNYLDWYFGLRRLFAEGSRPAILGVCLSTPQIISDATSGESFAHSLMLERDIFNVKEQAHLDNTMTTNYFFARLSSWLGHRAEIHNWILRKSIPKVTDLVDNFKGRNQALPGSAVLVAQALPRLRLLKQLCDENGTRFFLLIPPSLDALDASSELQAAAAKEGITVVLPLQHTELSFRDFLNDGTHLNPRGAAVFTARLGPALIQTLYRQ
jgi:hypothetical protein